jgi:2-methylaconitate cis-trans-isomerase PrpF
MRIPGSIPWELMSEEARRRPNLRIGHPAGVIGVEVEAETDEKETAGVRMKSIKVVRTARMIMD